METILTFLAVIFAMARPLFIFIDFNDHLEASYQAFAHILVGVLIGLWLVHRNLEKERRSRVAMGGLWPVRLELGWAGPSWVFLAGVEIVCAIVQFSGVFDHLK